MGDKNGIQDYYSSVCRTCLSSSGDLLNLTALINDNVRHNDDEISYMDCLRYCLPDGYNAETEDATLPHKICIDCASALQVAYWFMKNASKAQEVLRVRIRELQDKQNQLDRQAAAAEESKKPKRYRCKICNTKLETKRSLKDHVKLHLDIIAYMCQLCTFEHHQRNHLIEHYQLVHGVEATVEQLKPKTKTSLSSKGATSTTTIRQYDNRIEEQQQTKELQQQACQVYMEAPSTLNSHEILYSNALNQQQNSQNFLYTTTGDSINATAVANPLNENLNPITTTTIFAPTNTDNFEFNAFEGGELNVQNNPNDNEFIVMTGGTMENVMGKGVVIEYFNTGEDGTISLENGLVLDNAILQVQNPQPDNTNMLLGQNEVVQMDVDDLIVEDPENTPEQTQDAPLSPIDEDMIPASFIEQPKRINCKICAKEFDTQLELKNHMLTHNEIPHFFCENCSFYTFFKIDLHQHYKSKHGIQPTNRQLQPKNKQTRASEVDMDPQTKKAVVQKIERYARSPRLVYSCDICFYECDLKYEIRRHYLSKHRMQLQDFQQRPTRSSLTAAIQPISFTNIVESSPPAPPAAPATPKENATNNNKIVKIRVNSVNKNAKAVEAVNPSAMEEPQLPDYINGLNCRKCNEVFFYRNKLYEHYKLHTAAEEALRQQKKAAKKQTGKSLPNSQIQQTTPLVESTLGYQQQETEATQLHLQQQTDVNLQLQQQDNTLVLQQQSLQTEAPLQIPQQEAALQMSEPQNIQMQLPEETQIPPELQMQYNQDSQTHQTHLQVLPQLPQPHQEVVITTTPLDNAIQTTFNNVDAMSLVLTSNTNTMSNNPAAPLTPSSSSTYTLPSDAIPQIVEMEQTIETDMDFDFNGDALFEDFDDVDVENESDDNDLRNIVLTSDDDFDDMLKEQGETQIQTTTSYCAQCQKTFLSQYQFENHMFLHRGLAPYRCEMCTNLYNTKRALIRHYSAVHKKTPSRDMIQAKGDKVCVYDKSSTEYTNIEESQAITLMCAKCTYESTDFPSVQLHLNTNHSIHDDSYILRKLSFECPRCIRSFSTKAKLLRHLEHNHSLTPINETKSQTNSTDIPASTTATTANTNDAPAPPSAPTLIVDSVNMLQMNATSELSLEPEKETNNEQLVATQLVDIQPATAEIQIIDTQALNIQPNPRAEETPLVAAPYIDVQTEKANAQTELGNGENNIAVSLSPFVTLAVSLSSLSQKPDLYVSSVKQPDQFVQTQFMEIPSGTPTLGNQIEAAESPAMTEELQNDSKTINENHENDESQMGVSLSPFDMTCSILPNDFSLNEPAEDPKDKSCDADIAYYTNTDPKTPDLSKTEADSSYSSDPQSSTNPIKTNLILYKCKVCEGECTSIEQVRLHTRNAECRELVKISKKDNPLFKCEVCEAKYPNTYLLRHHLRRHIERKYPCSYCPKSYLSKIEVDVHQRMAHSAERPYKCDKCPNSFRLMHHLRRHLDIIHFGKRHLCPELKCNKQFSTLSEMKKHKQSHYGAIEPYKCKYCPSVFKRRLLLRKHFSIVHKKNLSDEETSSSRNINKEKSHVRFGMRRLRSRE
uniref:Uncharacterized protein n=1 Tax=Stomoxys calcitrans TaxID=35570 RepID=A0A1I8NMD0_STOCA